MRITILSLGKQLPAGTHIVHVKAVTGRWLAPKTTEQLDSYTKRYSLSVTVECGEDYNIYLNPLYKYNDPNNENNMFTVIETIAFMSSIGVSSEVIEGIFDVDSDIENKADELLAAIQLCVPSTIKVTVTPQISPLTGLPSITEKGSVLVNYSFDKA